MNFVYLCTRGAWFCEHCERFVVPHTEPAQPNEPARCPRCHKATVVWVPPVFTEAEIPAFPRPAQSVAA